MMDNIFQILPFQYFIAIIVFAPLLGALISYLIDKNSNFLGSLGIIISSVAVLIVSISLFGIKDARPSIITDDFFNFLSLAGYSFEIGFKIDELSLVCIIVASLVSLTACFYAVTVRFRNWPEFNLFIGLIMLFLMSDNFGIIFVVWLLTGAISYSIGRYSGATIESFLFLLGAVVIMNLSLQIGGSGYNTLNIEAWEIGAVLASPVLFPVTLLVVVACLFRMGVFPFLRPLETGDDEPISILISNAFLPLTAIYLLLRIHFMIVLSPTIFSILKIVSIITIIASSILALRSLSIKRLLSSSTSFVSGLILLSVAFGGFAQALILAILHFILKGAMCLTSSIAVKDKLGGLIRRFPVSGWCFVISSFILAGLPPAGVFFSLESILGVIKSFSTAYWLITIACVGLMSFALLRVAGLFYLGRRIDFPVEYSEYHPLSLILIVTLPTLAFVSTFLHASPFIGGTVLLPFLEGTLPSIPASFDGQKLSSALLLFVTAQPAIIASAVYSQRKIKKEQRILPKLSFLFGKINLSFIDRSISFAVDVIIVGWFGSVLKIVADFVEVISYKLTAVPVLAASLALIIIMILGGS